MVRRETNVFLLHSNNLLHISAKKKIALLNDVFIVVGQNPATNCSIHVLNLHRLVTHLYVELGNQIC